METSSEGLDMETSLESFEFLEIVDWHPLPKQVEGWNLSRAVRELGEGPALAIAQHFVVCNDCAEKRKSVEAPSSQPTPLESKRFWPPYIDERTLV